MANISYKHFTLGVEEEYMVLDPQTKELKSHEQKIVTEGQKVIKDKVKAEMHQAVVEVGTDICQNIDEACKDVSTLRHTIAQIAGDLGLWVGAAGTHPFSHWESQLITDHARYNQIVNELQEAARSNLIFGLHVHVGMENREMAIHIANSARYFLPHIYALSTNSPFWEGRVTGYKSFRTKVFDKYNVSAHVAEGNGYGTMDDLNNFIRSLMKGNNVLEPATVSIMQNDVSSNNSDYALGCTYRENFGYGHNGAKIGYLDVMAYDPETDVSLVVMLPLWDLRNDMQSFGICFNAIYDAGYAARSALGYPGKPH